MELMQVILRTGQAPLLSREEVWKRALTRKPPEDTVVDNLFEDESDTQESTDDLENFHGSMEEYFRQKKSSKNP